MTASNIVTTVSTTRSDMGSASALTGFLKDVYLPGVNETVYFDDSFTRLISKGIAKMDATGRRIIGSWNTQWSTGVGPIEEGGDFRDSRPVDGDQGYEWLKYINMYFSLSGPSIATVRAGDGSYVDIVSQHLTTLLKSARMYVERVLTGKADGSIAKVVSTSAANNTITVSGPAFFDTQFLLRGMQIEVHQSGAFGTRRTYDGSNAVMTIASTTRGNKRTSTNGVITINEDLDGSSTIAADDWVTPKNAYLYGGTTCLEPNGLMNLVSDGSSTTSTYVGAETANAFVYCWPFGDSSNGKNRTSSAYEYFQSQTVDVSAELDEDILLTALVENQYQYHGMPNLLVVTPRALVKYFGNTKDDRRFNTMDALEWTGGYKGLGIQLGMNKLMLTALGSVPAGYGFILNTMDFAIMRPPGMNGFEWVTGDSGNVLRQKEGSDEQFASAVDYLQFTCNNPGDQCKLYNITEV